LALGRLALERDGPLDRVPARLRHAGGSEESQKHRGEHPNHGTSKAKRKVWASYQAPSRESIDARPRWDVPPSAPLHAIPALPHATSRRKGARPRSLPFQVDGPAAGSSGQSAAAPPPRSLPHRLDRALIADIRPVAPRSRRATRPLVPADRD